MTSPGAAWMKSLASDVAIVGSGSPAHRESAVPAAPRAEPAPAPTRVRPFEERDRAAWNAFVHAHPEGTFFHQAEWRDVLQRAFGHRPLYLLAERGGEIRAVLPLAEVKSLLFGHALVSTPFCVYGGIVAADAAAHGALEDAACQLARDLRVDHLEMRNRRRMHSDWAAKDLYFTFRKPIDADAESNMLAIPRKQRAMVRKGIKEGLRAEIDPHFDRQLLPGRFEAEPELRGQAGQHLHVIRARRIALGPGHHRALLQAQRFVGHHQLRIEQQLFA